MPGMMARKWQAPSKKTFVAFMAPYHKKQQELARSVLCKLKISCINNVLFYFFELCDLKPN